jgi:hypothetical protein
VVEIVVSIQLVEKATDDKGLPLGISKEIFYLNAGDLSQFEKWMIF